MEPEYTDILNALDAYDRGERPETYGEPRSWYVVHPDTNKLYPLKVVWALATGDSSTRNFQTHYASPILRRLGFVCVDIDQLTAEDQILDGYNLTAPAENEAGGNDGLPRKVLRYVIAFERNPEIVAERLRLAKGYCECCKNFAPFRKALDNEPFLEVHHITPLSDGGEDSTNNTLALCPNCHRQAHFG